MTRYFKREGRGKGYEDVTREVAALRAERDALNEEANALSREATRLGAELGRVTAERDAMRSVVEAADAAVDADRQMYHGTAEHAEANMEATFTALYDAVDAYRVATSEQEASDHAG